MVTNMKKILAALLAAYQTKNGRGRGSETLDMLMKAPSTFFSFQYGTMTFVLKYIGLTLTLSRQLASATV